MDPSPITTQATRSNSSSSGLKLAIKAAFITVGVLGAQTASAIPSVADPSGDPCALAASFFCRFVPIAPDLEGDVDLTKQLPPADPAAPAPETRAPAVSCANSCF